MIGLGIGMHRRRLANEVTLFQQRVLDDGGTVEDIDATRALVDRLKSLGLYHKASLINTANAYKAGKLYSLIPTDPRSAAGDFAFSRNSTANVLRPSGNIESIAANVPAIEYENVAGVMRRRGMVAHSGATNLARASRSFDSVFWLTNTTRPTITPNVGVSPFGTTDADRIQISASGGFQGIYQDITVTSGISYTFSIWVKANGSFGAFRIWVDGSGTPTTPLVITPTNEWVLYAVTSTTPDTSARIQIAGASPLVNVDALIWHAQFQEGTVATDPVFTEGSTASRFADVTTLAGASELIGQLEGTVYSEFELRDYQASSALRVVQIAADANNSVQIMRSSINKSVDAQVVAGGATPVSYNSGVIALNNTRHKAAIAYKSGDSNYAINGAEGVADTDSFAFGGTLESVGLGNAFDGTLQMNGWIRPTIFFRERLTNAQLVSLNTL